MSSPITFSGFNQIDFTQILNLVMQQERRPVAALETQKSTLETQRTQLSTLAGKLSTLSTAVSSLEEDESLAVLSATSSDSGVGVSAGSGSVTGTYSLVVSQLARAQVTTSTSSFASLTTEVATGGTLTLTPGNGDAATVITLSGSTTLEDLADAINAEEDSPAAASVVQTSPGVYKLVLTGRETGAENAFTISSTLTGGSGLLFTDTDSDGVYGDSAADNTQTALDAALTVNGLSVTSSSNTVTDVIDGVTLSLLEADAATTVTVRVERDVTEAKAKINKFITAYNDILTFAKDQASLAQSGRASLGRDTLLRSLRETLRNAVMDEYTGGTLTRLAQIGVGFDSTGKMQLEEDVFDDAIDGYSSDVQTLVSGDNGEAGAFGAMADLLEGYTQAGGILSEARTRISDQVRSLTTRIDSMDSALAIRRIGLQREYMAADMAMTRLKQQSSSLGSVGGGYRLF